MIKVLMQFEKLGRLGRAIAFQDLADAIAVRPGAGRRLANAPWRTIEAATRFLFGIQEFFSAQSRLWVAP